MTVSAQISRVIPQPLLALRQTPYADLWSRPLSVRLLRWPATARATAATPAAPAKATVARAAQPASAQQRTHAVHCARAFAACASGNTAERCVASAASRSGAVALRLTVQRSSGHFGPATAGLARAYGHASPPPPGHDLEAESHLLHHRERGTLSLSEAEVTVVAPLVPMLGQGSHRTGRPSASGTKDARSIYHSGDHSLGSARSRLICLALPGAQGLSVSPCSVERTPGLSSPLFLFIKIDGSLHPAAGEREASEAGAFAFSAPRGAFGTGQRRVQYDDAGGTG